MAVSPTDWNYAQSLISDARRGAAEARENADEEIAETNKNRDEEVAELEEDYLRNVRDIEEDYENELNDNRERSQESLQSQKELQRENLNELKRQTYDRLGQMNVAADQLRDQLDNANRSFERAEEDRSRKAALSQEAFSQKITQANVDNARKLEEVAREAQESAQKTFNALRADEREDYRSAKEELQKEFEDLNARSREDQRFAKNELLNKLEEKDFEHERSKDNLTEANDRRFALLARDFDRQAKKDIKLAKESHAQEARLLRRDLNNLTFERQNRAEDEAEKRREALKAVRQEWRTTRDLVEDSYTQEIDRLKESNALTEDYLEDLMESRLNEEEYNNAQLLRKTKTENRSDRQKLAAAYERQIDDLKNLMDRQKKRSEETLERQADFASRDREAALTKQAEAFRTNLGEQKENYTAQLNRAQEELQRRKTTSNAADVSPAAEATIRDTVVREYEKLARADQERDDARISEQFQEYTKTVADMRGENAREKRQLVQQHAFDRDTERADFVNYIQDVESQSLDAKRTQQLDHDRAVEKIYDNHARRLEDQRRQFEDLNQQIKIDTQSRISSLQQEHKFESQLKQREFNERLNRTIREYERSMADQKEDYELLLHNQRVENEKRFTQLERERRNGLERQSKDYEQKIVQSEAQHEERVRLLRENYEQQLEDIRRANARLVRTKS